MLHTRLPRGLGQAEAVVQRVQVAGSGIIEPTDISLACDHAAHLVPVDEAQALVTEAALGHLLFLFQLLDMPGLRRGVQIAPFEAAIDAMARDALADQRLALLGHGKQFARIFEPDPFLDLRETCGKSGADLAAIAPGGAPTDPMGLQHHHPIAALSQFQRGGKPGVARADDHHVGADLSFQLGQIGRGMGARRVVGRHVLGFRHGDHRSRMG